MTEYEEATVPEGHKVEIGYLCRRGHFIFWDDPDVDDACGSKKIAGIYVEAVPGAYTGMFEEALDESRQELRRALGRAYQ